MRVKYRLRFDGVARGTNMTRLETERLILRPFQESDLGELALINRDPDVRAFADSGVKDREQTKQRLDVVLEHWRKHGFGLWAVILKAEGRFVGWCGVGYFHGVGDAELSYTLAKPYWGQGLATEATRAVVDHAFRQLGLPRILAHARTQNTASHRVMEKIGMTFQRNAQYSGKDAVVYSIENPLCSTAPPAANNQ